MTSRHCLRFTAASAAAGQRIARNGRNAGIVFPVQQKQQQRKYLGTIATPRFATTTKTTATTSTRCSSTRGSSGSSTNNRSCRLPLRVHETVREALRERRPTLALESTLIAHGMPYPQNVQLMERISTVLEAKGVVPAAIAIQNDACRVGLTADEIRDLAVAGAQGRAEKCSTRDVAIFLAKNAASGTSSTDTTSIAPNSDGDDEPCRWGATTVASTMAIAAQAGIAAFATGGIGGVHRGGEVSLDVSADLMELSRTPVVVVSAGIKSILDIPRTLEVLETYGVPVVAYQTPEMPSFFSPRSGVPAPARLDTPQQIASAYQAARDLNLAHGMLVAVPNTSPAGEQVEQAIQGALAEADQQGIHGADVTPFVLKRVADITQGESLQSNMALVERNVAVGADIAVAIAEQQAGKHTVQAMGVPLPGGTPDTKQQYSEQAQGDVVVVGGMVLDIMAKPDKELIPGTSNPAIITESDGGVGRNVAEVLSRLGSNTRLYSVVGDDAAGHSLLYRLEHEHGIPSAQSTVKVVKDSNCRTATFVAVLEADGRNAPVPGRDGGGLRVACADMSVLSQIPCPPSQVLEHASMLVLDSNPPLEVLQDSAACAHAAGVPVFWEPTSVPKALRSSADDAFMSCLSYISPNLDELMAIADGWTCTEGDMETVMPTSNNFDALEGVVTRVLHRMNPDGEAHVITTLGKHGVFLATRGRKNGPSAGATPQPKFLHVPVPSNRNRDAVANSTGAGDSFAGAFIHAVVHGKTAEDAVRAGMEAAHVSLQCPDRAISPLLSDWKH